MGACGLPAFGLDRSPGDSHRSFDRGPEAGVHARRQPPDRNRGLGRPAAGGAIEELSSVDLDFDIETTGFDVGEIDLRIASLAESDREPAEPPLPAPSGPAITQRGDLWLLGRHKVFVAARLMSRPTKRCSARKKPPSYLPTRLTIC